MRRRLILALVLLCAGLAMSAPSRAGDVLQQLRDKSASTSQVQLDYDLKVDDAAWVTELLPGVAPTRVQVAYKFPNRISVVVKGSGDQIGLDLESGTDDDAAPVASPFLLAVPFHLLSNSGPARWSEDGPALEVPVSAYGVKVRAIVDKDTGCVHHVEYVNTDGSVESADYDDFFAPGNSFDLFGQCVVSHNGLKAFTLCLHADPKVNGASVVARLPKVTAPPPSGTPAPRPGVQPPSPAATVTLLTVIVGLVAGALVMRAQQPPVMRARSLFAREVLVADGGSAFTAVLGKMGIGATACTAESLQEQREVLAARRRGVAPQAVVVTPSGHATLKSIQQIVAGYVEEGGRLLVLELAPDQGAELPFVAELQARPPSTTPVYDPRLALHRVLPEEMDEAVLQPAHLVSALTSRYDKAPLEWDPPLLTLRPGGVAIGIFRCGKGEVVICQHRIYDDLTKPPGSAVSRSLMLDLVDLLQARSDVAAKSTV